MSREVAFFSRLLGICQKFKFKIMDARLTPMYWDGNPPYVQVSLHNLKDVSGSTETLSIACAAKFNWDDTDEQIKEKIWNKLIQNWMHELYEYTTYEGQHIIDPHPKEV